MKTTALAALLAASVLALSSCSGGDEEPTGSSSGSASPTEAADSSTPGIITPADIPEIPELDKQKGVIADVTVEDCSIDPGEVVANGTATNSGEFERDIVVVINWAVSSTSDVVARGVATLEDVAPGDEVDWDVTATLDSDQPVGCVPTALAGQL